MQQSGVAGVEYTRDVAGILTEGFSPTSRQKTPPLGVTLDLEKVKTFRHVNDVGGFQVKRLVLLAF